MERHDDLQRLGAASQRDAPGAVARAFEQAALNSLEGCDLCARGRHQIVCVLMTDLG